MASALLYTLACFAATIALGACQNLSCYDCDPRHYGDDCGNPVERLVRDTPCLSDVANFPSICLSAYLNFTGVNENESGIYRGCRTLRPDVADFCDWFKQETNGPNVTVISCNACNSTRCNSGKFNADGTNSAKTASTAIFVLVLNSLFVFLLTVFD